jgi:hypothetical protein
MTTQYTPILKLALPVTGELSGSWGDVVNDNITSMVEQAIAGLATISTWTANAHTLTTANGTTDESRCAMLVAEDGAGLAAAGEIICPASSKLYVLKNDTSYAITLKTSGGSGVAVASGETAFLFCDGTNVNACVTTIIDGHITGNLTVDGNATINGNTTLGNATSDTITATARFASGLTPSADNTYDLGSSGNSWKDVYIDGTAYVALVDINGGTIDGVSIGATTPATFLAVDNLSLNGNTIASTDTNGNVVIAPNGTGDVQLDADTVRVGDSAAAVTLTSNGAGALTVTTGGAADLTLSTNSGTTSGTITIANGANGNITLTPDGTGDVRLLADTTVLGDSNTDTYLTTNGTGNLNLTTNGGTNSGVIQIAQGANGNITLTPNGTGSVSVPKLVVSTGTATRVPYITTGGLITDSANLTFNGTDLTVSGAVNAGSINATTLDLTNLEVTNIKAKDGTAGMQIADSTGVVSFTANPTLSGGTANGVAYLNGSKVLTTGSALTFDGSTLATTGALTVDGNATLGNASGDVVTISGKLGFGSAPATNTGIYYRSTGSQITGSTSAYGIYMDVPFASDVTTLADAARFRVNTAAAAYTLSNAIGLRLVDAVKGSGSTITTLHGLYVADQTQGATNYGIRSLVTSGSNKWNLYVDGTADNYFAGDVGINTDTPDFPLDVNGEARITTSAGYNLIYQTSNSRYRLNFVNDAGSANVDATLRATSFLFLDSAGSTTMSLDSSGVLYVGNRTSSVTGSKLTVYGDDSDTAATVAAFGQYNAAGTDRAYLAIKADPVGNGITLDSTGTGAGYLAIAEGGTETIRFTTSNTIGIGNNGSNSVTVYNGKDITGSTTAYGFYLTGTVQSDVTSTAIGYRSSMGTEAASFTVTAMMQFYASQATFGAGSAVTSQHGFYASSTLSDATNNYGFTGALAAASNTYNLYMPGSAQNYFAGNLGLGVAVPLAQLHIVGSDTTNQVIIENTDAASTSAPDLQLYRNSSSPAAADTLGVLYFAGNNADINDLNYAYVAGRITSTTSGSEDGQLYFGVAQNGVSTEVATIDYQGHLIVPAGITLGTSTATYAAANTLDDYEEGTWTPVIADATTGGNTGSATISYANYTKIGRQVTLSAQLANVVTTGMTAGNILYVRGLPFTSSATNSATGAVTADTLAYAASRTNVVAYIAQSDSWLYFPTSGSGQADSNTLVSYVTSGTTDIWFTVTYIV